VVPKECGTVLPSALTETPSLHRRLRSLQRLELDGAYTSLRWSFWRASNRAAAVQATFD
jgi:hypothetical protein